MTVSWFTTLLRMEAVAPEFAQSLELPLGVLRAYSPHITILGLFVVVGWRNRRGGVGTRRCVEVTVEMPTPQTVSYVLGYLTITLLVLDIWILTLLVPFALLGACNFRLETSRSTNAGSGPIIQENPLNTPSESFRDVTPPSTRRSKKLFHILDVDDAVRNPAASLLTPPATLPRRKHVSYAPQTPPVPLTERPSFRTRVSSTPSDDIRRTRKSSTNRRPASENFDENLVPKKEIMDTSFELLLYNLSKSRSRNSSLVEPHPRFNVSSPIQPLAPAPLINSS